jgi:hypothetical protein
MLGRHSVFPERLIQAAIAGEDNFVRRLMQHRKKPAFQTGTALQPLYLVLSLLDGMGLLDAYLEDFERFADFCQKLGIYGPDNEACDTESLAKTVRRFKARYRSWRHLKRLHGPSRTRISRNPVRVSPLGRA